MGLSGGISIFGEPLFQGSVFRQNYSTLSPIGDRLSDGFKVCAEKGHGQNALTLPIRVQQMPGDLAGHLVAALRT